MKKSNLLIAVLVGLLLVCGLVLASCVGGNLPSGTYLPSDVGMYAGSISIGDTNLAWELDKGTFYRPNYKIKGTYKVKDSTITFTPTQWEDNGEWKVADPNVFTPDVGTIVGNTFRVLGITYSKQ